MGSLTSCVLCGRNDGPLAIVADPFLDQSYGLCADCLAPIHVKFYERLRSLHLVAEEGEKDALIGS